ncbi:MAG: dicarboxylate/amino acid:cation symporter [Planctomycetaceae bacterium]|nr:dicarboxylate/amino acid:cation symporter [Planctomycetaceae bacterium]
MESTSEADGVARTVPLHTKIVIGLVLGAGLGLAANLLGSRVGVDADKNGLGDWLDLTVYWVEPIGKIFLRLMFMVVLPLVFSALSLAVVEIGDVRKLGRMGLRTLGYTAVLSGTAVLIGVGLVNGLKPGKSLPPEIRDRIITKEEGAAKGKLEQASKAKPLRDTLIDLIPENPLQEMVGALDGSSKGDGMLAVMVFSLIFGIAITITPDKCTGLVSWLEGLNAVAMTVIGFAMRLAPAGAGVLVFVVTAKLGFDVVQTLAWFVGTALLGLALHLFVTYSVVLTLFSKKKPWDFFRETREASLVAFSTSSSSATLPTAIKVALNDLKLPPRIANFVLTVGATGNQNGTALFEGVVVLFLAQVMGVELTFAQQFQVVLMAVLAGVGTAGVPGGSIPLIVVVMQSVGVPGEAIGIIIGVDRLLDMCRTIVNVIGDLVITVCVAASEPAEAEPSPVGWDESSSPTTVK